MSSKPQLRRRGAQALSDRLHSPAGLGAGEGISLQPLPDAAPEGGDRPRALPLGAPDQDLVPEPANEVEKRPQVAQHQDPLRRPRKRSRRAPWPAQRRPPRALVSPPPARGGREPRGGGGLRARGAGGGYEGAMREGTLGPGPRKAYLPSPHFVYLQE